MANGSMNLVTVVFFTGFCLFGRSRRKNRRAAKTVSALASRGGQRRNCRASNRNLFARFARRLANYRAHAARNVQSRQPAADTFASGRHGAVLPNPQNGFSPRRHRELNKNVMKAAIGIEPMNKGFAELITHII